jgi:hypothetical protein
MSVRDWQKFKGTLCHSADSGSTPVLQIRHAIEAAIEEVLRRVTHQLDIGE